ncbi:MAG: hypothetical protein ABIK28_21780 [Planctomycetota bacterium]
MKVEGSATIRAGTQDYKQWQFLESDGETAIDLTDVTEVVMRLKNETTGTVTEISTEDAPTALEILSPATDGKVQLRPSPTVFSGQATYRFHFILTDSVGAHPIPEDHDETLKVIDGYPPSA